MADWAFVVREGGHALMWFGGMVSGWWSHAYRMRSIARQEVHDAGQMALDMVRRAEAREADLTVLVRSYEDELTSLRRLRWQTMDTLAVVQAHALAARLIVRELDARLGLPRRNFSPLPPFPETDLETEGEAHSDEEATDGDIAGH